MYVCILTLYRYVAYVVSHVIECHVQLVLGNLKTCSSMCCMELDFSCKRYLQSPKFLVWTITLVKNFTICFIKLQLPLRTPKFPVEPT